MSNPLPYRQLTVEELESLKDQFIRFLVVQGIPADDWERIKSDDKERSNQLLDQFSQMVFDDVLNRAEYLEIRTKTQLFCLHCQPERIVMRGVVVEGESPLDFRRNDPPQEMLARMQTSGANLKIAAAERAYKQDRKAELFQLLESGHRIAPSAELYELFDSLVNQKQ